MSSLNKKIALITGATSGIGAATARSLAREGMRLILLGRRNERLLELSRDLEHSAGTDCHVLPLDVRDRAKTTHALSNLPEAWTNVELLVNNAGLSRGLDPLPDGSIDDWEEMIDTNVKGLLYVTRALVPGMIARASGHVINVGSIAGHEVYRGGNVYCATKYAVRALTQGLRVDVHGTPVRVTTVDPGLVETEFSLVRFHGDAERAGRVYSDTIPLTSEDVADVIVFCATRPAHVSIAELVLLPTAQASATLVVRKPRS